MHIPSFTKQILLVVSILFFVSCDQDYNEIGGDLLDQNNFETSTYTSNVIAYNEKIGPVQSNNLPVNPLGVFTNSAFGQTIASFATQVQLASVNPTIDPDLNQEIESVVLNIPYFIDSAETKTKDGGGFTYKLDSIYGKEDKPGFKLSIYESGIHLYLDPEDNLLSLKKYYTNQNADFDSYKIGNRLNDSIAVSQNEAFFFDNAQHLDKVTDSEGKVTDTTYSAPGMRLKLDKTFFRDKILKAPAGKLATNIVFAEYFRGLYFKVEKIEGQDGQLAMLDFSKGTITIKYKEKTSKTVEAKIDRSIILNLAGNRVSFLEDSNQNAAYSNALATPNKTDGDARLFLKGGEGSMAVVNLFNTPGELAALKANNWLINEANLVFYIDTENEDFKNSPEPQRIYLYNLETNSIIADFLLSNSKKGNVVYDGRLFKEATANGRGIKYKIRLTEHIKQVLKSTTSDGLKLGVVVTEDINNINSYKLKDQTKEELATLSIKEVPVASIMNPLGTILHGNNSENSEKKLKLEIHYTNPN